MFPHLVFVGARPEIIGKLLGVPVTLTAIVRTGTDETFERKLALRTFSTDVTDVDALLACAREIHAWRPIDAMIAATEHALLPTAIVGEALGVRVNPVEAVTLAQDKAAMRRRLAERGVETIAHRVCTDVEEVREFLDTCPGGVLLKPADGNGGRGVALVRTPDDIPNAWAHTAPESRTAGVLAEEFLTGLETSVETMSAGGRHRALIVPAKHTSGPPHFVEIAHQMPGEHPPEVVKTATEAVFAALDAIGYMWGPTNTEVMIDGDRATVVEINPRWGGARYWEMLELVVGVDMAEATALAYAYDRLPAPFDVPAATCAVRLLTPPPGRIVAITGLDEATAVDGVVRIGELNRVGDVMPSLTDFRGRAGYVLATGPDRRAAADIAEHAASLIDMRTIPAASNAKDDASMRDDVRQTLSKLLPGVRSDLDALIRIPSVSADPAHAADVRRSAELTARLLKEAGAADVEILDDIEGGRPAVVAHFPAPPDMPTVLLYAHHDVQPTGDPGGWTSPPFEPEERDGRLFARGSADDKAGIAAHLAVLRFFGGRPPVGVTVFVEGEEEIGSPTLGAFLERHRDKLTADVCVLADSTNLDVGTPSLTTTLRGMTDVIVEVRALEHSVHSGIYGGATPDALTALCRLLATLHDDEGRVAVEGLVSAPAPAVDYPEERFRAEAGLLDGVRLLGDGTVAERIWTKPALTVLAIDATPVAKASNTLTATARAKVSLRLAPGEDAPAAQRKLIEHLRDRAPWGVEVEVTAGKAGRPYAVDTTGPAFEAARSAYGLAYGGDLVHVGIGGTIPFIAEFADAFPDAAILVTSAGSDPDCRAHGLDESLHLGDFENACLAQVLLLIELARQNDKNQPARAI
ncbi:hypothetical protein GCM10023195_04620 [Actinoallomurus liliacearum]|uniref:ATP-grasp domain-containing protein n=1 Tax=Actinoallomurus liliacearum TaxID=1080073 RepID=A0ABP8TD72_9ACTN